MAVQWYQGCAWQRTEESTEPQYGSRNNITSDASGNTNWTTVQRIRETFIQVWNRPMAADSDLPALPVNPGNLPTPGSGASRIWRCLDRGYNREYGAVGSKMYYETWQAIGEWEDL